MSAVCDFYIECGERGLFPLEASKPRPAGVALKVFYAKTRWGERFRVTGIRVADAIDWWNQLSDREVPAPQGMREFLIDFTDCRQCDCCGQIARPYYFPIICSPEQLCCDCA
jgi:hypothetical protein